MPSDLPIRIYEQTIKDEKYIPKGMYCYSGPRGTDRCPYWTTLPNRPAQENGYCKFMEKGDGDEGVWLLWDQVKECGINDEIDEDV